MSASNADTRTCPRCNTDRPVDHFNRHKKTCKSCRAETQRDYVARNRERVYQRNKDWRDSGGRRRSTVGAYGITIEEYDAMLAAQGGVCKICNQSCATGRSLAVDHCHVTGKVRGLLCAKCNPGLGYYQNDPALLRAAAEYLEGNGQIIEAPRPGASVQINTIYDSDNAWGVRIKR